MGELRQRRKIWWIRYYRDGRRYEESAKSRRKGDAIDLADPRSLKRAKAERASDKARDKFGDDAVMTGRGVRIHNAREKD